jgi:hypothetical protein
MFCLAGGLRRATQVLYLSRRIARSESPFLEYRLGFGREFGTDAI